MKSVLVLSFVFATTSVHASLETQAQAEISSLTSGAKKAESTQSTDAVLPAESLSLTDDFRSPRARSYDFGFAIALRPHQIKGTGKIPSQSPYSLRAGSTWMPILGLGIEKNFAQSSWGLSELRLGLQSSVGFVSQEMNVAFQNQIVPARLNSTATEIELSTEISFAKFPKLGLGASVGGSLLSVTQTTSASLGQWTKQIQQNISSVFATYQLNPRWNAHIGSLTRTNLSERPTDISQDTSSYQAGFKVIW